MKDTIVMEISRPDADSSTLWNAQVEHAVAQVREMLMVGCPMDDDGIFDDTDASEVAGLEVTVQGFLPAVKFMC